MGKNTPALPPPPPLVVVSGATSKLVDGRSAPEALNNCERSSRVIPAGLAAAVEASAAIAARPALAVPRSGAPVSYSNKPEPRAEVTKVSRMTAAREIVLGNLCDRGCIAKLRSGFGGTLNFMVLHLKNTSVWPNTGTSRYYHPSSAPPWPDRSRSCQASDAAGILGTLSGTGPLSPAQEPG